MTGPGGDGTAGGGPADADATVAVLLVDDDENWTRSTAELLEQRRDPFDVTTALTLEEASAAFDAVDPDCVVCDHKLEAGTGLDFLEEVRDRDRDLPFVLVTGRGSEALASDATRRRVTEYLPKRRLAGHDDLLARRVESAVEAYRTRRALDRERRSKEAMLDILTATSSREALTREFCEHLVRERDYDCAWFGALEGADGVVPRAIVGGEGYVEAAVPPGTAPSSDGEPALAALARGERVVARIDADVDGEGGDNGHGEGDDNGHGEGWRALAAAHGFDRALAAPVTHEGTVFGVLAVYASGPPSDPDEPDLLAEYAGTVGYALRSAGWKESLLSATPVAVEFDVSDSAVPLVALDGRLPGGARVEVLTAVPGEESLRYVLRIAGATASGVRKAAGATTAVESVVIIAEGDPVECELVVAGPTPETVVADAGGRVVDAAASNGRATVTAATGDDGDVPSLVEAVRGEYPGAGLRSVGATDHPSASADGPLGSLTEKQRRALELAYYSGYFERPREHDTTEVAEKMGITRQTLSQHLRAGQRKLFSDLFESGDEPRGR